MSRILLLRHGETTAPDVFHGCESNVGLSQRGQTQAEAAAERITAVKPRVIYSSALRRALETAAPIARACGLPVLTVAALHERCMGELSGQSRVEFEHIYEEAKQRWSAGDLDYTHPGGESFAAIRDRVVPAFAALVPPITEEPAVVVAHGIVIRVLLCSLVPDLGPADFGRLPLDYVRIYDLRIERDRWRLAGSYLPAAETSAEARSW